MVTYWVQEARELNTHETPHLEDLAPEEVSIVEGRQLSPVEKINQFLNLEGMCI